jgi:hypothetical protein
MEKATDYEVPGGKCPHCNKQLIVPMYAAHNVECYGNSATVMTTCCEKPIRLARVVILRPMVYEGTATEDDWGTPIK